METNAAVTQKNIEMLRKTQDAQIDTLLQNTFEKLRKTPWITARRKEYAPQEVSGQPSVPFNAKTFIDSIKHISKHPVREEVAHYAIKKLYSNVTKACKEAMTAPALSILLYKAGQNALSTYFDLCSVSEENNTLAQEYAQLAVKLHEGRYQLRSPFHTI